MVDIKKVEQVADHSGHVMQRYANENPVKAFSGGKVKFREYEQMVQNMESLLDLTEQEVGIQNSCVKGCSACCNHSVFISQFEAELIINYLQRNYDKETYEQVKKRIYHAAEMIDQEIGPMPENLADIKKIIDNGAAVKDKYFNLQITCPLLSEEKTCMVYSVRPSPCWSYRVYGNPDDCQADYDIPHSIAFSNIEEYFAQKKLKSEMMGSMPKRLNYKLYAHLPQKLKQFI